MGTAKAIKNCIKRQSQKMKKNVSNKKSKAEWLNEQCQLMTREVERRSKDANKRLLKEILKQTREWRTKDTKALTATQTLSKYAALRFPELV